MQSEFTAQTRKDIKREVKALVKDNLGRCIGIQLLYFIPYALLMVMLYATIFGKAVVMLASGAALDEYRLMMAVQQGLNTVWLVLFLMLAITGPLQLGMMHFYASLSHGEDCSVGMLFHPFTSLRSFWAGIRMSFTIWLRGIIWSIVPTMLYTFVLSGMAFTLSNDAFDTAAAVLQIVYLLAMIPIQLKLQTYGAGWLLLVEDDSRGAWAATREASAAFSGQLGRLFVFDLSFIGWYVLMAAVVWGCLLLGTLGAAVLTPGMAVAVFAAVIVAALCLGVVLNGFISAYFHASFLRMYEHLRCVPAEPFPFEDGMPQFTYTPVEPTEAEQRGESAPQTPEDEDKNDTEA